jgi:hypothetical protein
MAKTLFSSNSNGNYSNSDHKVSIKAGAALSLVKGSTEGLGKTTNEYGWTIIKQVVEIDTDLFAKVKSI